jgi:ubiquinone/menaquinone biosynthesis C-methylase UbiE
MNQYDFEKSKIIDKELISIIDELPLWSAPFGLSLLEKVKIGRNLSVLDIGFGTGFPLIEIAQRLGESSRVYGIDPWKDAIDRALLKITKYEINNVGLINGRAEKLPFGSSFFDIIVSNNGLNNVEDLNETLSECSRVSKKGAQLLFTMNLEGSMIEFYNVLNEELEKENNTTAVENMKKHIYEKRRPLKEIRQLLNENAFNVNEITEHVFFLRFADCSAMFGHSLIKYWFFDSWKKILEPEDFKPVFSRVLDRLNKQAEEYGDLKLTIPYAVINCVRI